MERAQGHTRGALMQRVCNATGLDLAGADERARRWVRAIATFTSARCQGTLPMMPTSLVSRAQTLPAAACTSPRSQLERRGRRCTG